MIDPRPLRLAIVGTMFGAYGVAAAARQMPDMEVVALCGQNAEKTAARAKEYRLPRADTDWRAMLDETRPDLCAITTPPGISAEITAECLRRGIGVMVEKLPAMTAAETQQLAELAAEHKVANVVNYLFPQLHSFRAAKDWLRMGRIGTPSELRVKWQFESYDVNNNSNSWKLSPAQGGGIVAFFLSHTLHYCEDFMGPAQTLTAHCSDSTGRGGETQAEIQMQTAAGTRIYINGDNAARGQHEHSIVITGAGGRILLQNTGTDPVRDFSAVLFDADGKEIEAVQESDFIPQNPALDSRAHPVARLLGNLCDQYRGQYHEGAESFYAPRLSDAARVQTLIDAIRSSNQTNGAIDVHQI